MENTKNTPPEEESGPPIFQTWNQMYLAVLIFHFLLIALFTWFTNAYA